MSPPPSPKSTPPSLPPPPPHTHTHRTQPKRGCARFGSVPVVRCKAGNRGLQCLRLDKRGRWVACKRVRRTRSLTPVKSAFTDRNFSRSGGDVGGGGGGGGGRGDVDLDDAASAGGDTRRCVKREEWDCSETNMPVPNSCEGHVLDHMR